MLTGPYSDLYSNFTVKMFYITILHIKHFKHGYAEAIPLSYNER